MFLAIISGLRRRAIVDPLCQGDRPGRDTPLQTHLEGCLSFGTVWHPRSIGMASKLAQAAAAGASKDVSVSKAKAFFFEVRDIGTKMV